MKEEIESIMNKAFHTRRGESIIGVKEAAEEISKLLSQMKLYSIKPLEWVKKGVCCLESLDPTSGYYILLMGNGMWGWSRNGRGDIEPCDTLNEAKSKAQEDWNNRISQYLTEYKETK